MRSSVLVHSYKPHLVIAVDKGEGLGPFCWLPQVPRTALAAAVGSHGVVVSGAGAPGKALRALVVQWHLSGGAFQWGHVHLAIRPRQPTAKQTVATYQNKARTVAGFMVLRLGMRWSWMGGVMRAPPSYV